MLQKLIVLPKAVVDELVAAAMQIGQADSVVELIGLKRVLEMMPDVPEKRDATRLINAILAHHEAINHPIQLAESKEHLYYDALKAIVDIEGSPIWTDSRDDAADEIIVIAKTALE